MSDVTIIGAGYVGLCTGVVFAKHGHRVRIVDVLPQKVEAIRRGEAPFYEPGLREALRDAIAQGRLEATTDLPAAVHSSGFVFLCVGTPQGADGASDLSYIRQAAADVGAAIRKHPGFCVVVTKSTVPPGTAEDVVTPEIEKASGLPEGVRYAVAANPEFLKEGSAMKDALEPDRIVVGARRPDVADHVLTLYSSFSCPKLAVDTRTAEMIKYAANAFLAVKIAFSNEMANVCERIGVDWYDVAKGIGHDARIGPLFLRAGCGFGGSCFPKDVAAIAHVAKAADAPSGILRAVLDHNARQPLEAVRMLREEIGRLEGKRIALLGLAFKPDTDDVRETRALPILRALVDEGADVVCHDPQANGTFRALVNGDVTLVDTCDEALDGADGCIVQTEWSAYRDCPPETFARLMRKPVVIDGRRTFDSARMAAAGVRYRAIGLGTRAPAAATYVREPAAQRVL